MSDHPHLVVFTGAGLSADSGISTFRDANGLWENHKIDEVCNHLTWKRHREQVYGFYNGLRAKLPTVAPNPMHCLLADWQRRYSQVTLITQNVDDLLERAGCADVMHVHGYLPEMQCEACGTVWSIGYAAWGLDDTCPKCGSKKGVKPHVVMFHENAPLYANMWRVFRNLRAQDVLVVIGTRGEVVPIGSVAAMATCRKALNNLEPIDMTQWAPGMVSAAYFNHALFKRASEAVDELDGIVRGWMDKGAAELDRRGGVA